MEDDAAYVTEDMEDELAAMGKGDEGEGLQKR